MLLAIKFLHFLQRNVRDVMLMINISRCFLPFCFLFFLFVARAQIFPNKMGFVLRRGFGAFNISGIPSASTRISLLNRIRLLQTINAGYIGDVDPQCLVRVPGGLAKAGLKFRTLVSRDECFPHGRLTIGREAAPLLFPLGSKSSLLLCFRIYARFFQRSTHR